MKAFVFGSRIQFDIRPAQVAEAVAVNCEKEYT
jgi:hypothetical protein